MLAGACGMGGMVVKRGPRDPPARSLEDGFLLRVSQVSWAKSDIPDPSVEGQLELFKRASETGVGARAGVGELGEPGTQEPGVGAGGEECGPGPGGGDPAA